jgi:hypothetical protein
MIKLVYVSRAVAAMDDDGLIDLLEAARSRNQVERVTGVLIYARESFMQHLEGEDDAVDAIYASIVADPRHTDIRLLTRAPIEHRQFAAWWMWFELTDPQSLAAWMPGYHWPTRFPLVDTTDVTGSEVAESLLRRFAATR